MRWNNHVRRLSKPTIHIYYKKDALEKTQRMPLPYRLKIIFNIAKKYFLYDINHPISEFCGNLLIKFSVI